MRCEQLMLNNTITDKLDIWYRTTGIITLPQLKIHRMRCEQLILNDTITDKLNI